MVYWGMEEGRDVFEMPKVVKPEGSDIDDLVARVKVARVKIETGESEWQPKRKIENLDDLSQIEQVVAPVIVRAEVERRKREEKLGGTDELSEKYKVVVVRATEGEQAWLSAEYVRREADNYMGQEQEQDETEQEKEERVEEEARRLAGEVSRVVNALKAEGAEMGGLVTELIGLRKEFEILALESKHTWQELAREAGVGGDEVKLMEEANIEQFDLLPIAVAT